MKTNPEMTQDNITAFTVLTEHTHEIIAGSYKNVDRIFRLTDGKTNSPEIAELAEAFGMMSVKVEAREYALEHTIEELREKQTCLDNLNRIRTQLTLNGSGARAMVLFSGAISTAEGILKTLRKFDFMNAKNGKL